MVGWMQGDVGTGGLVGLEAPVADGSRPWTRSLYETSSTQAMCFSLVVLNGLR